MMSQSSKPVINDAIVGNGNILAAYSHAGELVRCWWPSVDFSQHIEKFWIGVIAGDGDTAKAAWLRNYRWNSEYLEDTNILSFRSQDSAMATTVTVFTDCHSDVLLQRVEFAGSGQRQVAVAADFHIDERGRYQAAEFFPELGVVTHYFRDVYVTVGFLENRPAKYHVGEWNENLSLREVAGNRLGLASQSSLVGATVSDGPDGVFGRANANGSDNRDCSNNANGSGNATGITVCIAFGHTRDDSHGNWLAAQRTGYEEMYRRTYEDSLAFLNRVQPWPEALRQALRERDGLRGGLRDKDPPAEAGTTQCGDAVDISERARRIYRRSVQTFRMLQGASGGLIAAPEFDEDFSRCGGYAFCWGRDAAFIVTAMEAAGMNAEADAFYRYALDIQDEDGLWNHRHYLNGMLAPSWGVQLDETAELLLGLASPNRWSSTSSDWTVRAFPAMTKAARALVERIDQQTGLLLASVDLWEERTGQHLYSTAAAVAGLRAFAALCRQVENDGARASISASWSAEEGVSVTQLAEICETAALQMEQAISSAISPTHGGFLRGRKLQLTPAMAEHATSPVQVDVDSYGYERQTLLADEVVDVSLLGLCIPFGVVDVHDPTMVKTAELISSRLTREVGGIGRYEGDTYAGGNPWILATLWLAMYHYRRGETDKALDAVLWVVEHATPLSFLPEQIHRLTGETAWVNPLAWSHAMFILFALDWR